MKRIYLLFSVFLVLLSNLQLSSQQIRRALGDTSSSKKVVLDTVKPKPVAPKKVVVDTMPDIGVAITPSTMRFSVKPGTLKTLPLKITNDTKKTYNFQIGFQDYGAGDDGNSDVPVSKYAMYSLSKYMIISPTVVELKPREQKVVNVTVDIPAGDSMAISMWSILTIDQVLDRDKMEVPNLKKNAMGMGVKNSMGFGVYVYQNPPNVIVNNVEILAMNFNKKTDKTLNSIYMKAKNAGNGIGYCMYYLELTNLVTGKQTNLKVKQFAIFPGYNKEFNFELPADLEKGAYSAMAVLDFGNKDELQTAELEFQID